MLDFWMCPQCGSANTPSAAQCYGCGARRLAAADGQPRGSRSPYLFIGAGLLLVVAFGGLTLLTLLGGRPSAPSDQAPPAVADAPASARPTPRPTTSATPSPSTQTSPTPLPASRPTATSRPTQSSSTLATNVKVIRTRNWAGFGLIKGDYTDVSAEWVEPQVDCTAGEETHVAFWVGLDGVTSHSVEQIGTAADCSSANDATAVHYAWVEMYPHPAQRTILVSVHPGDHFKALVHATSEEFFRLRLDNLTTGQWFERSLKRDGDWPTSAEWVIEPPLICQRTCDDSTLAQFADVTFTNVSAGTADGTITLGQATGLVRFDLRPSRARVAKVSALTLDGPSFDVSWLGEP